ncbi:D-amino acid dehydrogenase [Shewanella sediminis HAW-EB3]|uniref:D-amino acid dehydrogenase n=1 Tax=Shewanella sediminis (strain HAW-EB3) TaxID=425104 RepID=A8FZ76_SHESH|nr:FAD-dependent oxidoreductase [Shewanella sediminis]ABV38149.1 D-amino acid dehydrogenase [Shewanella sediminis HAW-EB3]
MMNPETNRNKNKEVAVIGGGIIGLCSAYYLHKAGRSVVVVDKGEIGKACSFGNAGYITPSHFVPLAAPGMIQKGLKWMLNPQSPFFVRPSLNLDFLLWLWSFAKKCTKQHTLNTQEAILDINLKSLALYEELHNEEDLEFQFYQKGLLMLYKTEKELKEEAETVKQANRLGLNAKMLSPSELKCLEPNIDFDVIGAAHYPEDAHIAPYELLNSLRVYLETRGVEFIEHAEITSFNTDSLTSPSGDNTADKNRPRKLVSAGYTKGSEKGNIEADEFILANGAWSGQTAASLGLKIPVQAGKGISITLSNDPDNKCAPATFDCRTPFILSEAKVAVTPFNNEIRFGGTMELGVLANQERRGISQNRIKGLLKSAGRYLPAFRADSIDQSLFWSGFRPCSPDGLPIIGRCHPYTNLTVSTGHAMMGLSLGPISGKLVSEIITGSKTSVNLGPFDPNRFHSEGKIA